MPSAPEFGVIIPASSKIAAASSKFLSVISFGAESKGNHMTDDQDYRRFFEVTILLAGLSGLGVLIYLFVR